LGAIGLLTPDEIVVSKLRGQNCGPHSVPRPYEAELPMGEPDVGG
jgi:hypothetical protein